MSNPKVGDVVRFPPDRGLPGGMGKVVWFDGLVMENIQTNPQGDRYVCVHVKSGSRAGVWPSNRLGYKLDLATYPQHCIDERERFLKRGAV